MKTIIVNKGKSRQGKSKAIIKTAELLKLQYPNAIIQFEDIKEDDVKMILTINAIKIGIESKGDPNSRLASSLVEFTKQNCNIILCASRSFGSTVTAVRKIKNKSDKIIWVANARSGGFTNEEQPKMNDMSATHFLTIINYFIEQKNA